MSPARPAPVRWLLAALVILALVLAAWAALRSARGESQAAEPKPALLVFTSLPIYWNEAEDLSAMLRAGEPPWPRRALEARYRLVPLDTLAAAALAKGSRLLMAQPRPLAPGENVALDAWVAEGGRLLLFADPALTAETRFAIGDRRRPQDVVLLSPILARWGLRLEFDEDQAAGARRIGRIPVNLPGRFAPAAPGRPDATCAIGEAGLIARCRVGRGSVTAMADAALFEDAHGESALQRLTREALK